MAVIRCPSCGKPNPDFLDICQYCDTPLHGPAAPVPGAAAPASSQPAAPEGGESDQDVFAKLRSASAAPEEAAEAQPIGEIPDWLSRLGGPGGGAEAAPAEPGDRTRESASKVSSWLDSLKSEEPEDKADSRDWYWTGPQGEAETPASTPAAPAAGGELPDWLRAIDTSETAQAAPAVDETAGLPDWLQGVSATSAAPPEPPQPPPPAAPAPAEQLPDWLQGFGTAPAQPAPVQPTTPPSPAAAAAPFGGEELPDWLQGFGGATPAAPAEPAPAQPAAAPSPSGEAAPFGTAPGEELPDWLQVSAAPPAAPAQPAASPGAFAAEPAEELPDWLQGMGAAPTQLPEAAPAAAQPTSASPFAAEPASEEAGPFAAEIAPGDELPGWLRTVGSAAPPEEATPAIGEVPDWLQSFDSAIPEQPPVAPLGAGAPSAVVSTPEEDLPEWLRTLGTGTQATPTMPPAEARPTAWLGTPGAEQGGPAIIAPETSAEEQPEWLRGLGAAPAAPEAAAEAAPAASEEQPDWLRSLGVTTPLPGQPAGVPPLEPSAGEEQPEWLRGLGPTATLPASQVPSGTVSPFGVGEATLPPEPAAGKLPDWLAHLAPAGQGQPQPTGVTGVHLAPVALPGWLEAMRPVEIQRPTITPEVDDYEETVGVLAGLHGVLRAQPAMTQPGKSATQVHKLAISDAQAKQADLLVRTLAQASEAHPAAKRSFWLALPLARLAVFAVLLVAFVTPLVFPEAAKGFFTAAPSWNQSAQKAFNLVDSLSPAQPVLVAFDYDPAQAGELDPLAQAIISHLARHSVPVVGISTSPVGAATGEALLDQVFTNPAAYGSLYVNLGYLPGGPVGMLQMTSGLKPLFAADYRGDETVWDHTFLTHTQQLSDFGAIVLVSATPDTVRAWVEQLQYLSRKPPVIAAVSAGADPLVRPYYDPDPTKAQIKGLVTGILGAAQYERQSGVPGVASGDMWDVLGWGLLAVIVVLVAGNVFYGVTGLLGRKK